jgi:hypothetical protein
VFKGNFSRSYSVLTSESFNEHALHRSNKISCGGLYDHSHSEEAHKTKTKAHGILQYPTALPGTVLSKESLSVQPRTKFHWKHPQHWQRASKNVVPKSQNENEEK